MRLTSVCFTIDHFPISHHRFTESPFQKNLLRAVGNRLLRGEDGVRNKTAEMRSIQLRHDNAPEVRGVLRRVTMYPRRVTVGLSAV